MNHLYLGLKTFIGTALLAAPVFAGPTKVNVPTNTGPQATMGNVSAPGLGTTVSPAGGIVVPGLGQSNIPGAGNITFPGAKFEGTVTPQATRSGNGPVVQRQQTTIAPSTTKLQKKALSGSGVNQAAFTKNAAPTPTGAPVKTEKTGIAAIDGGLAEAVGNIQARKQPGAGGIRKGTNQGDLDKLFEQIGKRSSSKDLGLPGSKGSVALKEVSVTPEAQVKSHAAQAVRSVAEAHAAGRSGDKATQLQRVSEAGQFMIKARAVVQENEIPASRVAGSFSTMQKAAKSLGSEGVVLLANAAIAAAGRADKNAAFDYGNQLNEIHGQMSDAGGKPYIAGYGSVLSSLKRGLSDTVGRTSASQKENFAAVEVEEFSGTANPRVRMTFPSEFVKVTPLDEAAFIASMKMMPDAIASLDTQLELAGEGIAMHAAMKFGLNTQGFLDHKRNADAELAARKASNPFGMRGFFIAARRYFSESLSGVWKWIMAVLERFGFSSSSFSVPALQGTTVTTDGLVAVRASEARSFPLPAPVRTAEFGPYTAVPVH